MSANRDAGLPTVPYYNGTTAVYSVILPYPILLTALLLVILSSREGLVTSMYSTSGDY
ncbi:hypothetical protein BV25DRAFT_1826556 [Artomyces pyxidatus]|uniref:Uncharacterized protein n=1 Tax=Artomyces pyxidatus TaxID=48021 RepID=A0ACB8SY38_9AGAM|nr:hypothetical protein BV25DRAFT_1826556 [Artomyces pyxidatus]